MFHHKPYPIVVALSVAAMAPLLSPQSAAETPVPIPVVMPDALAASLEGLLPKGLRAVPRTSMNVDELVEDAARGGDFVWIGPPDELPADFWIGTFTLSDQAVEAVPHSESPLALPPDWQATAMARSAYLHPPMEFPKHNINEEIRADFLPILAAKDRFGQIIGYPGVLMSHMAPSLAGGRFEGCQGYFFFFDDPASIPAESWRALLAPIAARHASQLRVEYVETNFASYAPGERVQVRARVKNDRDVAASLNVRIALQAPGANGFTPMASLRRVAGAHSATEAVFDLPAGATEGLHRIRVEVLQDLANATDLAVVGAPVLIEARETAVVVLPEGWSTPEFLTIDGPNFAFDGESGFYIGTHYYPSNVWWEWAWRDFRPALADRDFTGMRAAGNRLVRVWADPTLDEIALRAKDAAVWIAAQHGITLDVCVFNQWVRDLAFQEDDGTLTDFQYRHPDDFNIYSFSLRNLDLQQAYLGTLAKRWTRTGNVIYNLANETYVKNPDASQMDLRARQWEEARLPEGMRRDTLLFQRWGVEMEIAVREAGGKQMVFPGYMFSLSDGGDAYLANRESPFMTWHGYFSPEGVGQTVHYFDALPSNRPLLLEEFGNLGWNGVAQYDGSMHYALASGAGIAMAYEWGISWMARESSFIPLPMRDALDGEDPRWFQPIVDYARENAAIDGVGIAPWPSGWGYGSIYHGTPFPAEAARAMQRLAWFGERFARTERTEEVYLIAPEANAANLGAAMALIKQLWLHGVIFGVWREEEIDTLPESTRFVLSPAPVADDTAALLASRGLASHGGTEIPAAWLADLPRVTFTPAEGINAMSLATGSGTLYALYGEQVDITVSASANGHTTAAGLDSYVLIQSGEGGPSLVEGIDAVTVDGIPLFETNGARVVVAALEGMPLMEASAWKIAASNPVSLSVSRPVARVEVLLDSNETRAPVAHTPGATRIDIDAEMTRYPVVVTFEGES